MPDFRAYVKSALGTRTSRPAYYPSEKAARGYIDRAVRDSPHWADGWVERRDADGKWQRLSDRGKLPTENP